VSANESVMSAIANILRLIIKKTNGSTCFVEEELFIGDIVVRSLARFTMCRK